MDFIILGAGLMGRAVALDLCRGQGVSSVHVVDVDEARIAEVEGLVRSPKLITTVMDVTDRAAVVKAMEGQAVAISCVPYRFNLGLARAAIEAGCSFIDLGGNNDVVAQELALDHLAKAADITIVPDCGLAPGLAIVLVADAMARMDSTREVHIRVGGLPLNPQPPLDYMLLFSPGGLVNEYREPAIVIRDGSVQEVAPLEDMEEVVFPEPFGVLEAFSTSGGTSTLPRTLEGKVDALDYKTIRYRGHCEKVRVLRDLGLFDETPVIVDGREVVPRRVLEALLARVLPSEGDDVVLVRITVRGDLEGEERTLTYTIVDHCDKESGLSAMMRTTAFPASIVAQMIASGEITAKGAQPQELVVPPKRFIEELERRGVHVEVSIA